MLPGIFFFRLPACRVSRCLTVGSMAVYWDRVVWWRLSLSSTWSCGLTFCRFVGGAFGAEAVFFQVRFGSVIADLLGRSGCPTKLSHSMMDSSVASKIVPMAPQSLRSPWQYWVHLSWFFTQQQRVVHFFWQEQETLIQVKVKSLAAAPWSVIVFIGAPPSIFFQSLQSSSGTPLRSLVFSRHFSMPNSVCMWCLPSCGILKTIPVMRLLSVAALSSHGTLRLTTSPSWKIRTLWFLLYCDAILPLTLAWYCWTANSQMLWLAWINAGSIREGWKGSGRLLLLSSFPELLLESGTTSVVSLSWKRRPGLLDSACPSDSTGRKTSAALIAGSNGPSAAQASSMAVSVRVERATSSA